MPTRGVTEPCAGKSDVRCRRSSDASSAPPARHRRHLRRRRWRGRRPLARAPRARPGLRRRAAGPRGARPATTSRSSAPTTRDAGHRHPGHLAGRRHHRRAAAADAAVARSRSSWPRPASASATPTPRCCVVDPELAAVRRARAGRPADGRASTTWPTAIAARVERARPTTPTALAILQFTSGSTSRPQGRDAPAPRRCCANLDAIAEAAGLDADDDVLVSWLPLYHDMGLVGLLTLPMTTGTDLVLGAPQDFTARPARWMEWMSTYGGTATAGPNFSYVLATRALQARPTSSTCPACASRSTAPSRSTPTRSRRSARPARRHGLRPGAVFPAFGMAEVGDRRHLPRADARACATDCVDRRVLETERYAAPVEPGADGSRRLAAARPRRCPGLEIRIVDPDDGRAAARPRGGRARDPRHVGDARLLQAARRQRRRCSTTAGCAPATSPTCSTASSSCAAASRT